MRETLRKLILPLCLLLLLAACGQRTPTDAPAAPSAQATPEPAPWEPEAIPAIAGEESAPPEAPSGEPDGMEGSYYNDFLRETLTLDGRGGCALSWPGGVMGGVYEPTETGLTVRLTDIRLDVYADERGNLAISGRQGSYLRDWDFWGITPAEAGIHPTNTLPDTEEYSLGDGTYRYRDFAAMIALTYDETMQIVPGRLGGAVTVADGKGGYVIGRNVTQAYLTRSGSVREFLQDYLRAEVFSDCAALCGAVGGYDDMTLFEGGETAGRLGAGEARLSVGTRQVLARVILYTSVFPDGTENFICKCVLAPDAGAAEALARAVRDVGAARIVQVS